jgi:hypothetical protein
VAAPMPDADPVTTTVLVMGLVYRTASERAIPAVPSTAQHEERTKGEDHGRERHH